MPRAKPVKDNDDLEDTDMLDYPGPDEFNNPPLEFDDYMLLLYGLKGAGKTTCAASFPDTLTLMLEPKRKGLIIRQLPLQKFSAKEIREGKPDTWTRIKNTTQKWIDDPTVKRLNYDSVDILYECCQHSVCASHKVNTPGDAGRSSSDVWLEIRDEFSAYFDALRDTDMRITMTSHVKEREEATLDGGKMGFAAPSCSPACLKYIKQAVDIVLFVGYYNGYRAAMVRDTSNSSFVANGAQGKFLQPNGKPLSIFQLPNISDEGNISVLYQTLKDAFDNKLWDIDTPEDQRVTDKPKPTKPSGPPKKGPPRRP